MAARAVGTGRQMRRAGFTLVELLIVLGIIAILMSLAMPLMTLAGREARKSATRSVMVKVDSALRLFRGDIGTYPWQRVYDDPADPVLGGPGSNNLFYRIGTDISSADRALVLTDAKTASDIYANANPTSTNVASQFYINADFHPECSLGAWASNRAAEDRVRLAVLAGNLDITNGSWESEYIWYASIWASSHLVVNADGHTVFKRRTLPQTPLLSGPQSAARPGWAGDYLVGELPRRHIAGDAILDAWGRPLLYVCQVIEGVTIPIRRQGWQVQMWTARSVGLHPAGRTTLAARDTVTGDVVLPDPVRFPDPATPRHSDRRYYAPRGGELDFELWSAGADGRAEWMRDAPVNTDNVSMAPYDKLLP